jgi:hypothetical protein
MPCEDAHPIDGSRSAYQCIYCPHQSGKDGFTREHVLSEAFGKFKQTLVLHRYVCAGCNEFFANGSELLLTRNAFEGFVRYQTGIKKAQPGAVRLSQVEFEMPPTGAWAGVRLRLVGRDGGVVFCPDAQLGYFSDSRQRWIYVTEPEIDGGTLAEHPEAKKKGVLFRLFASTADAHDALISKLTSWGINYTQNGQLGTVYDMLGESEDLVAVTFTLNKSIWRCIAKYALNYLACGRGNRFACLPDFDAVRKYARYGTEPGYSLIGSGFTPILQDDEADMRQTKGHLITLSWDGSGQNLFCDVSIFNQITYRVLLCRGFTGLWRPIRNGHHYDLRDMSVKPLLGISKSLMW